MNLRFLGEMRREKRVSARYAAAMAWCVVSLAALGAARAADLTAQYTWKPVRVGAGGWMRGFVTHPQNANVRYIRADVDGSYRWDNTNGVWVPMKTSSAHSGNAITAPSANGCSSIAVDPNNTSVVLIAQAFPRSADVQSVTPSVGLNVYRSTNGGQTFTAGNLNLSGSTENDEQGERLSIDPTNSNIVYFGSPQNGLWRSTNGGLNWSQVTAGGAPGTTVNTRFIRFDPGAGTGNLGGATVSRRLYCTLNAGSVLQSDDGGNNWTNISSGQGIDGKPGFAVVDASGNLLVAEDTDLSGSGYWKRTRGGAWSKINPGGNVQGIAPDPANSNRVFALSQGGGVRRTNDGGANWTDIGGSLTVSSSTIGWLQPSSIRPQNHYISCGGLYMDKNGNLWIPCGNEGCLTTTPNDSTNSSANPPTWAVSATGIEEMVAQGVVIPPGGKPVLAFEDESSFYINDPDLFNATHFDISVWNGNNGLSSAQDIAYCPNKPSFIVMTTSNCFAGDPATKNYSAYSNNGGVNWTLFGSISGGTHPPILYNGIIAVSARSSANVNNPPGSDNIVWIPSNIYSQNSPSPFYSTNGGASWTQTQSFNATPGAFLYNGYRYMGNQWGAWNPSLKQHNLEADPVTPGRFYLHLAAGGFWRSTDGGVTWSQPAGASQIGVNFHHGQMKAVPGVSGDLWIADGYEGATDHGLWHTTNGGDSFTKSSAFQFAISVALGKAASGQTYPAIYVYGKLNGDANWGVFRSTDAGSTWDRISYYPTGLLDVPACMAASWDTFGVVYIGFKGNSFVYGQPSGVTGSGTGLRGTYFNNKTLTAPSALVRTDATVNFDWGTGSYASGQPTDNFSARWEGQVQATVSGNYTFSTTSDDGVRLYVNGSLVINNWTDHAPTTNTSGPIALTAGTKYNITMEFYENGGGAVAKLLWTPPGGSLVAIPQSQLYPPATNLVQNPGYESGLTNWQDWGTTFTIDTANARSGANCLRSGSPSSAGGGQQFIAALPNTSYTLSAWGKITNGLFGGVGYGCFDSNYNQIVSDTYIGTYGASYSQVTGTFTTPANTAYIRVFLWNAQNSYMYVDDWSLTKN